MSWLHIAHIFSGFFVLFNQPISPCLQFLRQVPKVLANVIFTAWYQWMLRGTDLNLTQISQLVSLPNSTYDRRENTSPRLHYCFAGITTVKGTKYCHFYQMSLLPFTKQYSTQSTNWSVLGCKRAKQTNRCCKQTATHFIPRVHGLKTANVSDKNNVLKENDNVTGTCCICRPGLAFQQQQRRC